MYLRHLLPGLAIAPRPPAMPDALPRMDVALFVGFAARGPVHRPVAIEALTAYRAVFGEDLPLVPGHAATLGPTVRAFFANGGTRCHVVRVCRSEALERLWRGNAPLGEGVASAGRFRLPGVTALPAGDALVRAASLGSWSDHAQVTARVERVAVPLDLKGLAPGELVELSDGTGARDYAIARAGSVLEPLHWASPPATPERIDRLRLVLGVHDGDRFVTMGPFGLTPEAPASWFSVIDDDAAYADPGFVAAARDPLAPDDGPAPLAWLPVGLDQDWAPLTGPLADIRTPIERDGLSRFDAELFLDPGLADSRGAGLITQAQYLREGNSRPLFGIHASLCVPGGTDYPEPSLIAAPDAAQPGWTPVVPEPLDPPRPGPFAVPPSWRGHGGPCPPEDKTPLSAPDATRFLDCGTRLLPMPAFLPVDAEEPGPVLLRWTPSDPGATYVLLEAGRADFSDAVEIWRGPDLERLVDAPRAGSYYYAVRAELDGNISRTAITGFRISNAGWEADIAHYRDRTLLTVQRALLRLCGALGDQFALLGLPEHYRADAAAAHRNLLAEGLAANEWAALQRGALHHPWPVTISGPAGAPLPIPPEGPAAGVLARRARERGAWIAPARVPLADVIALSGPIADVDREALAAGHVNAIVRDPHGFLMSDTLTLSDETDWREIGVRRLIDLIRRAASRRGATYVFEPNGDVLRRVIERSFGHMLDDMLRRGAFAGKDAAHSYRLMIDASDSDRMNGRLTIEIAVAPARPMRFLTVVLRQIGERLAVVEER